MGEDGQDRGIEGLGRDVANLYAHFPFCRRKCAYCALHSRPGVPQADRDSFAAALAGDIARAFPRGSSLSTVYFGGGSPALCDLRPVLRALEPLLAPDAEFTVELHPLDAAPALLDTLAAGGVNRVSMGVQSLDDATLRRMGRGYSADEARRAFDFVSSRFANCGIDLVAGYPGSRIDPARLAGWPVKHCSVYSLILEEGTALESLVRRGRVELPDDDAAMDEIALVAAALESAGLERYEISNYASRGFECRHNAAVWAGEDYVGLGEGAHGRIGLLRTRAVPGGVEIERAGEEEDFKERRLFALRTRRGLDAAGRPDWEKTLAAFACEGLVRKSAGRWVLTARGTEVCDSILAALV